MSGIQLNKCAISMGKVLKMIEQLEPKINSPYDCVENKEEFFVIGYVCRVGILDRVEKYPNWINSDITIRIPTGLFSSKKKNISEAMEITIGRLLEIASYNVDLKMVVEDLMRKGNSFYEFEQSIPENFRNQLKN